MLTQQLRALNQPTDLIILPEMFTTGFSMDAAALAEPLEGPTLAWLTKQAEQYRAVITGSYMVQVGENYFNRLIWMQPDGTYQHYDKHHLFRLAGETEVFTPGQNKVILTLKGWRICPLICYDLRFPVWSRNRHYEYDVLLYVANWPETRRLAWQNLLAARAIENQSYVIGINRVGEDGNHITYTGDSGVYEATGQNIWQHSNEEIIHSLTLDKIKLEAYRKAFPADLDADDFVLK
jgi:predicted amidohydrolase